MLMSLFSFSPLRSLPPPSSPLHCDGGKEEKRTKVGQKNRGEEGGGKRKNEKEGETISVGWGSYCCCYSSCNTAAATSAAASIPYLLSLRRERNKSRTGEEEARENFFISHFFSPQRLLFKKKELFSSAFLLYPPLPFALMLASQNEAIASALHNEGGTSEKKNLYPVPMLITFQFPSFRIR